MTVCAGAERTIRNAAVSNVPTRLLFGGAEHESPPEVFFFHFIYLFVVPQNEHSGSEEAVLGGSAAKY